MPCTSEDTSIIFPFHILSFKIYLEVFSGGLFVLCIQGYLVNNFVIKAWKKSPMIMQLLPVIVSAPVSILSSLGCYHSGSEAPAVLFQISFKT